MAGAKIGFGSGTSELTGDASGNAKVNLPLTSSQAGYAQQVYVPTSTLPKIQKITESNAEYSAELRQLIELDFNSASTTWAAKIGTNATTMTKAVNNGFMRLNSGAITTLNTGISIYTTRTFVLDEGYDFRLKFKIRHANFDLANKEAYAGLGYYAFAANQAAANNEFIGFKWTTGGLLLGVVTTSTGGAGADQTVSLSVQTNNVTHEYELVITDDRVEFWIDGTYQNSIAKPTDMYAVTKSASYPILFRLFNSGIAPSSAPLMDIADVSFFKIGGDDGLTQPIRAALVGKSSYYFQPDLQSASTATHLFPASGTAPTANAGSNTASAANNVAVMGGIIRNTLTGVTVTLSTNILWIAYQNPSIPTAAGAANNARNFIITGIHISPMVVTAALTGGGFTAGWFAAIGATATSLATTDADGTTAVAQKAPRIVPLPLISTLGAAAALGTVSTNVGDHQFLFTTPLVVHPGEFIHVGFRTIAVTAAVTAGSADCLIGINGYWD